ncbi:3'(2'),5'-bisphosphate nucleotidase CysQ [Mucilaginibacter ginsenosidivorax]|uniref:3'(2'),5'-bisphosphate nucleotidase CysQ n=1 Tax=Mucilaginibacter ginsenosidivorax TaxID=862126 RepID=A0A5B8W6P5_9SPHI|nr:3'(2'),5'-bisphosphate nucleotidase CysQ [Mucilaginibacter ginsenosidivorax]QEC79544.1 3'(2'),5'-bisphosphate nucleotidase CysQ [Mucilaginibacter ginsenosidivorax]
MENNTSIISPGELTALLLLAKQAGSGILSVYNTDIEVTLKDDLSPLTLADKVSHDIITEGLTALTPAIPIISEEGKDIPYETRKNWEYYWCVDPLDGTKEFIKRNGEFTVNIALMHNNTPVLGIIYVPVTGDLYYGGEGIGSWKETAEGGKTQIYADVKATEWISVGSRSHASAEEASLLARYPVSETISIGSSIKFCLIAEGKAHIYYRQGPTMEWDTAAGQAIAVYSGATMSRPDGEPFEYNKPSLLNGSFLVKAG